MEGGGMGMGRWRGLKGGGEMGRGDVCILKERSVNKNRHIKVSLKHIIRIGEGRFKYE